MDTDTIWKILEVLFIGATTVVTVAMLFRSKHVAMHDRISKVEDKLVELSVACIRREEFHTCLEPVRGDIADLRRRIDDFINNMRNKK